MQPAVVLTLCLLAVSASVVSSSDGKLDYTGHSIYKIKPSENDISELQSFFDQESEDMEIMSELNADENNEIRISEKSHSAFLEKMRVLSIDHEQVIGNLQYYIDNENTSPYKRVRRTSMLFDFNRYHPLEEIMSYLKHQCLISQQNCTSYSIGESTEGRELYVIQIGTPGPKKDFVWLDGGIHAREWITPATILNLLHALTRKNAQIDYLLEKYVFYVLPVLNPDGYEYSWTTDRMWRKNRKINSGSKCVGVDLNRNWGFYWGGSASNMNPCTQVYHGAKAFSEPETEAVSKFILRKTKGANLKLFLSLHSNSQKWLVPYAFSTKMRPNNLEDLIYVAKRGAYAMERATGLPFGMATPYTRRGTTAGQSYDWAKGTANAHYSYILELRFRNKYGFILPARYIAPTFKEVWAGLTEVLKTIAYLDVKHCSVH